MYLLEWLVWKWRKVLTVSSISICSPCTATVSWWLHLTEPQQTYNTNKRAPSPSSPPQPFHSAPWSNTITSAAVIPPMTDIISITAMTRSLPLAPLFALPSLTPDHPLCSVEVVTELAQSSVPLFALRIFSLLFGFEPPSLLLCLSCMAVPTNGRQFLWVD